MEIPRKRQQSQVDLYHPTHQCTGIGEKGITKMHVLSDDMTMDVEIGSKDGMPISCVILFEPLEVKICLSYTVLKKNYRH